ncbi:MAG: winged helix-turn-helix domain-containing protein [Chloroflexales bacterium]|nr:winged helix-turn-helix domain-containing protein [Chloroflexales bacterium]
MVTRSLWASYAPTYRSAEMQHLASWIASGASGSVVGLVGCGRSNLLKYLCEHPSALQRYLPSAFQPVVLVSVDLNDLPSNQLADLYRTILHAFYWVREGFTPALAAVATELYLDHRATSDSFLAQKALYELLLAFQNAQTRVVLVMNRFDRFCETSTPPMVNTLRSLRDRFKETLSYIVGMRQAVAYLPDPTLLGDMYELFDNRICYVGAFTSDDARHMLADLLRDAPRAPGEADMAAILSLCGGFPSLIKATGDLWALGRLQEHSARQSPDMLLDDAAIQYRLERLWQGLTQEEKLALTEIQKQSGDTAAGGAGNRPMPAQPSGLGQHASSVVQRLVTKGCCRRAETGWQVNGTLLAAYVARNVGSVRGRIWFDVAARAIYQGQQSLDDLTPLEFDILRFLILNPHVRHPSDAIIDKAWPPDENKHAITPNNLQVHISSIRKKIEPNPSTPRYLITWNGRPGGYQFFPEGKPE